MLNLFTSPSCRCLAVLVCFWTAWFCPFLKAAKSEEFPGESEKWRRYQSPHFELFSANRDYQSREMLHNLELLRALFFDTFKIKEREPLELSIYYFADKDDFFKYVSPGLRGNENLAGYHMSHPDRATIVVSPAWDDELARHVIFHEYIHYLIRISGEDPPLWYNEGVAELYSSIEIGSDFLEIGRPLPWHLMNLRENELLPLENLFAVDRSSSIYNTGTHSGDFYAEAWALLHFWYYGKSKLDHEKVSAFMNYIRNETNPSDPELRRKMFRDAMGMDYPAMRSLLQSYIRGGTYSWRKVPLPSIPAEKTYEWRPMGMAEVRERLAELDLRANQSGRARLALLRAADQSPVKTRTLEVLGADAWSQGEQDTARERWQKAIEAGSLNAAIYREIGLSESRRWFSQFNFYFQMNEEVANRLRNLLKRSIEYAPDQSEAYEMLAWVEATVAKPDIANINLVEKRLTTLTHQSPTLVAFALARFHLKDRARALEILQAVESTEPGPHLMEVIRLMRIHFQPVEMSNENVVDKDTVEVPTEVTPASSAR